MGLFVAAVRVGMGGQGIQGSGRAEGGYKRVADQMGEVGEQQHRLLQ